ncbi:MAG TPA: cyclic 2,3-diphosphoglycerate synthase [Bacillota bacterium]
MGAAGRDFHNFNVYFRDNPDYQVIAFTATQIPDIEGRVYPPELAGHGYPEGIPIYPESDLTELVERTGAEQVIFAYSDVPFDYVMHRASQVLAAGADFRLMGPRTTMLRANRPVVAVTAVRTGVGKSQTTRRLADILRDFGHRVVAVRHPMPYGNLLSQAAERFANYEDLEVNRCTIEEREEFEPLIDRGVIVYAGVDYERILRAAEREADVVIWDGGNNDIPFYVPDLHIVLVDPHRPGHEVAFHPGETNLRMADVVIINKVETADREGIEAVRRNSIRVNPNAVIVDAASPIYVDDPGPIRGQRALVIEDGPTLTHGEMQYGAGVIAARKYGASQLIDPRPYAVGTIARTYEKYPKIGTLLPAMGYNGQQIHDLQETINACPAEVVVIATPIDLRRLVQINRPAVRVRYELQEIGHPDLVDLLDRVPGIGREAVKGARWQGRPAMAPGPRPAYTPEQWQGPLQS